MKTNIKALIYSALMICLACVVLYAALTVYNLLNKPILEEIYFPLNIITNIDNITPEDYENYPTRLNIIDAEKYDEQQESFVADIAIIAAKQFEYVTKENLKGLQSYCVDMSRYMHFVIDEEIDGVLTEKYNYTIDTLNNQMSALSVSYFMRRYYASSDNLVSSAIKIEPSDKLYKKTIQFAEQYNRLYDDFKADIAFFKDEYNGIPIYKATLIQIDGKKNVIYMNIIFAGESLNIVEFEIQIKDGMEYEKLN